MIFSRKCAYAIQALTRLAMLRRDGYLLLERICDGTDLPRHYVAKIFSDLKRRGLLTSAKGPGGGFALARQPDQITLFDIITAVDGVGALREDLPGLFGEDGGLCIRTEGWMAVRRQINHLLTETTLAQISNRNEPAPGRDAAASEPASTPASSVGAVHRSATTHHA